MSSAVPATLDRSSVRRLQTLISSPRLALAGALLVALLLFQAVYGLRLLNAGDAYWTNPHGDMGQMVAGELAGLRAPWSLPLLVTRSLTAPDPVSLVYTDSIPWLTALLKLLHLGPVLSLLGTFLFLAWLAQAGAMYLLLRACGVERRWTLFTGSVLALLIPAFLGRQIGHIALSGHALQIAGLALAVHAIRRGVTARVIASFLALGVLAVGVHAYHVPPISLMFVAALASDSLQRRSGALARAAWGLAAYLVACAAAAWVTGYFVGRGTSGGVAALGLYEMMIQAPFWPQGSWLAGHRWSGGWFTHTFDPNGNLSFEGHNYLGAGVLVLLGVALVLALKARGGRRAVSLEGAQAEAQPSARFAERWGPLLAAMALLIVYAVGPTGWLGAWRLWSLPLPQVAWIEPLAMFRSHGRFFWTVGYGLLALGLVTLDKVEEPWPRRAMLLLVLGLQGADALAHLQGLHQRFARAEPLDVPAVLAGPAGEGREYRIFPNYFCTGSYRAMASIRQLALVAQQRHGASNTAEVARAPADVCSRPVAPDALVDATGADRRITAVLTSDTGPDAATAIFANRRDCHRINAGWLCGRGLSTLLGTPIAGSEMRPPAHRDLEADLPTSPGHLLSGWSKPEPGATGVWSNGPRAVLRLPTPARLQPDDTVVVTLQALSYQPGQRAPQRVRVAVGGAALADWKVPGGLFGPQLVRIPASTLRAGGLTFDLTFDLPDAAAPSALEPGSGDPRLLGIGVKSVSIAH